MVRSLTSDYQPRLLAGDSQHRTPKSGASMAGPMTNGARRYRLASIDMLRGLVMVDHGHRSRKGLFHDRGRTGPDGQSRHRRRAVLHALDHALLRAHVHIPRGYECWPMVAQDPRLGGFLFTRGMWLIVVEWFVIATAWSFAPWGIEQTGGLGPGRSCWRSSGPSVPAWWCWGWRPVPRTARVRRHRRRHPPRPQRAGFDMARHGRHLRRQPPAMGGTACPDGRHGRTVFCGVRVSGAAVDWRDAAGLRHGGCVPAARSGSQPMVARVPVVGDRGLRGPPGSGALRKIPTPGWFTTARSRRSSTS